MSSFFDSDLSLLKQRIKKRQIKKIFLNLFFFLLYIVFLTRLIFSEGALLDYLKSKKHLKNKKEELFYLKKEIAYLSKDIENFSSPIYQQEFLKKNLGLLKRSEHLLLLSKNLNKRDVNKEESNVR